MKKSISVSVLLGTEHSPGKITGAVGKLGEMFRLAESPEKEKEKEFLVSASMAALYIKSGAGPVKSGKHEIKVSADEKKPECSPASSSFLARMLSGEHPEILEEWLSLLKKSPCRAPTEYVVRLLETGTSHRNLRQMISLSLGERGAWLASLNSEWSWVCGEVDDSVDWQTAGRPQRIAYFRRLRSTEPAKAIELLTSTWDDEVPEDKVEFIDATAAGLGPADEVFLETALRERRKDIRSAASSVLCRLPDSAYCRRMLERLGKIISYTPPPKTSVFNVFASKKGTFDLKLPDAPDAEMGKDGITPKSHPEGTDFNGGEKAMIVFQMLMIPAPSKWCSIWGGTPEDLIASAVQGEWKDLLMEGWTRAAATHMDEAWARAILSEKKWISGHVRHIPALLAAVKDREGFALEMLSSVSGDNASSEIVQILGACDHSWSEDFSRKVLKIIFRLIPKADWTIGSFLGKASLQISPSCAGDVARYMADLDLEKLIPSMRKLLENFTSKIQFRREMHDAFNSMA